MHLQLVYTLIIEESFSNVNSPAPIKSLRARPLAEPRPQTKMEAVFVAWHRVSDDFQIAVVVCCAFSTVNLAIAVQILELDVSRAVMEITGFQSCLACNAVCIIP